MSQEQRRRFLIEYLLQESQKANEIPVPKDTAEQWQLLRALMNVRPATPADKHFLEVQDAFLKEEIRLKGIVGAEDIFSVLDNCVALNHEVGTTHCVSTGEPHCSVWRGDITRLRVDAIVNAANSSLLGCFIPGHHCVDNAIHTYAGVQLRIECADIVRQQGFEEPTGGAKITSAYNLPSKYVMHTVGPIVMQELTDEDKKLLASCYRSCLELAHEHSLHSLAFCCISTGVFGFPQKQAAAIAFETVQSFLQETEADMRIIFNTFTENDYELYTRLLSP